MHSSSKSSRRRTLLLLAAATLAATSLRAQTTTTTGNLLTNPGAELGTGVEPGTVTGWTVGGTSNPGRDNGTFDPGINPYDGAYDFYGNGGNSEASGTLTQRVDLLSAGLSIPLLNATGNTATFSFYEESLFDPVPDTAGVNLFFLNAAGMQIGTATSGEFYNRSSWAFDTNTAALPAGTQFIDCQLFFVRHTGVDIDSYLDDVSLTVNVVPEPSTWAAGLATGACLLALVLRRRARLISDKLSSASN